MKNRVILNAQGVPVVPGITKAQKLEAQVKASDARAKWKDAMNKSFLAGFDSALDSLKVSFESAKAQNENAGLSCTQLLELLEKFRVLAKERLEKGA